MSAMSSRRQVIERQNQLLRLLPEVRWRLRHVPGIQNVGVGAKETGGGVTREFAFRVYVDQKLPRGELSPEWRIPERIKGIPTDVLRGARTEMLADAGKHRPLKGGYQLKNEYVEGDNDLLAGTIGCLVQLDVPARDVMALSCEHVLMAGQAALQARVGQPRWILSCCCCTYNQIGKVAAARKNAEVDCAIVKLDPDIVQGVTAGSSLNLVEGIGTLTGAAQAVCFEHVRKRGRTTELTHGQVVDVLFEGNQILVHPTTPTTPGTFADRGDSGSVIVNDAEQVIGLLWATDAPTRTKGVANHIGPVMREMNVRIAGQAHTGLTVPAAGCGSSSGGP